MKRGICQNDLAGKAAVVTGGTKGIGLATGLALGRRGARVYATYKWGSADLEAVRRAFADVKAPEVVLVEADAAQDEDTERLLGLVRERHDRVEVFVSNVSFAQVGGDLEKLTRRALSTSLRYSAWPMVSHLQKIHELFGRWPRYVIGMSCDGPDTYYPGYDFVAASKAVMEVLCRYIATHLLDEDVRINILRSRPVSTDSLVATFGAEFEPFLRKYYGDDYLIEAEEVADAVVALTSGLMDAVSGEVILLDRGTAFCDNLMRLFEHRGEHSL
jgi:NAD(P)-dependent dehydrogenase (short-subunit alcohol dehydrogenase family)